MKKSESPCEVCVVTSMCKKECNKLVIYAKGIMFRFGVTDFTSDNIFSTGVASSMRQTPSSHTITRTVILDDRAESTEYLFSLLIHNGIIIKMGLEVE